MCPPRRHTLGWLQVRYGLHGGALETSLMLHLRPELVSMEAADDFASRAARRPKTAALQVHPCMQGHLHADELPHCMLIASLIAC